MKNLEELSNKVPNSPSLMVLEQRTALYIACFKPASKLNPGACSYSEVGWEIYGLVFLISPVLPPVCAPN